MDRKLQAGVPQDRSDDRAGNQRETVANRAADALDEERPASMLDLKALDGPRRSPVEHLAADLRRAISSEQLRLRLTFGSIGRDQDSFKADHSRLRMTSLSRP